MLTFVFMETFFVRILVTLTIFAFHKKFALTDLLTPFAFHALQHASRIYAASKITTLHRCPLCSVNLHYSSTNNKLQRIQESCLCGSHVGYRAMCLHCFQLFQTPFQLFQRFYGKSMMLVICASSISINQSITADIL